MIALSYPFVIDDPRALHDKIEADGRLIVGVSTNADPEQPETIVYLQENVPETEKSAIDETVWKEPTISLDHEPTPPEAAVAPTFEARGNKP